MTKHIKPTTDAGIKRLARELKANGSMKHSDALDSAARQAGFENYRHAKKSLTADPMTSSATGNSFIVSRDKLRQTGRQRVDGFEPYHEDPTIIVKHTSVVDDIIRRAIISQPELSVEDLEAAITAASGSGREDIAPRGFERHRARPFNCHAFDIEIAARTGAAPEFWVQDILHEMKEINTLGVGQPISVDNRNPGSNDMYHRAAKAALTIAANAALRQGLVDMDGGKRSWEKPDGDGWTCFSEEWEGIPFFVTLRSQSFYEINFTCAFWTPEITPEYIQSSARSITAGGPKFGELTASACVERLTGKYVSWSAGKDTMFFTGKNDRIREMAKVSVKPIGYNI
ncbi:hypothetical protein [Pseudosulfitobacter pseudonitzschiae]|uniref:hypothetical protein n=1 Tax=Pseudosulfitobacter pseudonitzschiae TaxID=1402135 RepID=UPI003B7FBB34